MNLSATADFPSLCVEYISISLFYKNDLLQSSLPSSTYILFSLQFDSSKTFWTILVDIIPFLSFKGITHAYLP